MNMKIRSNNTKNFTKNKLIQPWRMVTKPLSRKMRNNRLDERKKVSLDKNENNFKNSTITPLNSIKNQVCSQSTNKNTASAQVTNNSIGTSIFSPPASRKLNNSCINSPSTPLTNNSIENSIFSPPTSRKLNNLSINSPSSPVKNSKRKKSIQKMDDKKVKIETYAERLHNNIKELHKKNSTKPEIPMWVELSHDFRREKIQTSSEPFINLYNDFNYLSDPVNLQIEFLLIIKKTISDVRDSLRKILIVLFKHFKIKAANEFDGFIKTIQVLEKEIKTKNQASIILIEKTGDEILQNRVQAPRVYIQNKKSNSFILMEKLL